LRLGFPSKSSSSRINWYAASGGIPSPGMLYFGISTADPYREE